MAFTLGWQHDENELWSISYENDPLADQNTDASEKCYTLAASYQLKILA